MSASSATRLRTARFWRWCGSSRVGSLLVAVFTTLALTFLTFAFLAAVRAP